MDSGKKLTLKDFGNIEDQESISEIRQIELESQNSEKRFQIYDDIISCDEFKIGDETFYERELKSFDFLDFEIIDQKIEYLQENSQKIKSDYKEIDRLNREFLEELFINYRVKELDLIDRKEEFKKNLHNFSVLFKRKSDIVENFKENNDFSCAKTNNDHQVFVGQERHLFQKIDHEIGSYGKAILSLWKKLNSVEFKIKKSQESYDDFVDDSMVENLKRLNIRNSIMELQIAELFKIEAISKSFSKNDISFLLNEDNNFLEKNEDFAAINFSLFNFEEDLQAGESLTRIRQSELEEGIANLDRINYEITKMENILSTAKRNFNQTNLKDFESKIFLNSKSPSSEKNLTPKKITPVKFSSPVKVPQSSIKIKDLKMVDRLYEEKDRSKSVSRSLF